MASTDLIVQVQVPSFKALAAAFTEWERRFREEPDAFMSDHERIATEVTSMGERQAAYLVKVLTEQRQPPVNDRS